MRAKQLVVSVCTWTKTMSQWNSARNVQKVRALRLKCRVKYLSFLRLNVVHSIELQWDMSMIVVKPKCMTLDTCRS